jgi:hypothetical protein
MVAMARLKCVTDQNRLIHIQQVVTRTQTLAEIDVQVSLSAVDVATSMDKVARGRRVVPRDGISPVDM